jgi:cell division protein FtsL
VGDRTTGEIREAKAAVEAARKAAEAARQAAIDLDKRVGELVASRIRRFREKVSIAVVIVAAVVAVMTVTTAYQEWQINRLCDTVESRWSALADLIENGERADEFVTVLREPVCS